ncbi:MAG: hypothetical protein GXY86_06605 [Firmicutes bacterium]|nr:hypothetical protein [Bacillota bacterium]
MEEVADYKSGLRLKKQGNDKAVYYVFDTGGNVLYEQENRKYLEYVYVLGKHFARVDGNLDNSMRKKYFYHTDHLGSTVAVTDEVGQTVWASEYTPFGGRHSVAGEMAKVAKFTGKDLDEDIGLYYFNARWYDQEIGRFISEDPIKDGLNWYQYTYNNPIEFVDPDGQKHYLCIEKRTYGGKEVQYYSYYGGNRGIEGSKIITSLLPGHSILQGLAEKHLMKMKPIEKQDIVSTIRGNVNEIDQYASLLDLISNEAAKNGGKLLKSAKSVGKTAGIVGNVLTLWDAFDWFASTKQDQIDYLISFYIGDSSTVTVLKNIGIKSLNKLAKNYGWK